MLLNIKKSKVLTPITNFFRHFITVIAEGEASYLDAQMTGLVLVIKENWPDAIIEDDAITLVITLEVKPLAPKNVC